EERLEWLALVDAVEDGDSVADDDVGLAAEQQLHAVELSIALPQLDVESGLLVKPGRQRLIEAAMLGLGKPVGEQTNFLRGARPLRTQQRTPGQSRGPAHECASRNAAHDLFPPPRHRT